LERNAMDRLAPRIPAAACSVVIRILGVSLSVRLAFFRWWYHCDACAPLLFVKGGAIAASGGFATIGLSSAYNPLLEVCRGDSEETQSKETVILVFERRCEPIPRSMAY